MTSSKSRLLRLLAGAAAVLAAGLGYAAWVSLTGLAIPCPVHALTGLWCPGCGVTRMCLALLGMDLAGAWRANPGLLLALPAAAVLLGSMAWRYVRQGKRALLPWQTGLVWALVVWMLGFGVPRNLPAFSFLAPQ